MFPPHILSLLSLAATTVTAIDLRLFDQNNCRRNYWVGCNGANPGFCCFTGSEQYTISAGLFAIPRDWSIVCQWWDQTGCSSGPLKSTDLNYGADYVCRSAPVDRQTWVHAISYVFNGRKREVEVGSAANGCQRANILHLEDGSEYDLAGLSNETYNEVPYFIDRRDQACGYRPDPC